MYENEMVRLYVEEGWSGERIARRYGTYGERVRMILRKRGVTVKRGGNTGEAHGFWKGGRLVDKRDGYVRIRLSPDDALYSMAYAGGYAFEHRYVVAQALGRPLEKHETIHHIDGDKTNNQIQNLELRSGHHGQGSAKTCGDCGSKNIVSVPLA